MKKKKALKATNSEQGDLLRKRDSRRFDVVKEAVLFLYFLFSFRCRFSTTGSRTRLVLRRDRNTHGDACNALIYAL
jgi:hypothetical protein